MLASRLWWLRMTIVDREAPESSRGALRGENEGIMAPRNGIATRSQARRRDAGASACSGAEPNEATRCACRRSGLDAKRTSHAKGLPAQ